jgi:hypothetical protein
MNIYAAEYGSSKQLAFRRLIAAVVRYLRVGGERYLPCPTQNRNRYRNRNIMVSREGLGPPPLGLLACVGNLPRVAQTLVKLVLAAPGARLEPPLRGFDKSAGIRNDVNTPCGLRDIGPSLYISVLKGRP